MLSEALVCFPKAKLIRQGGQGSGGFSDKHRDVRNCGKLQIYNTIGLYIHRWQGQATQLSLFFVLSWWTDRSYTGPHVEDVQATSCEELWKITKI